MARQFSWKSDARAAWPRWKSVMLIELTVVIFVIGALAGRLLFEMPAILAKVRVSEAMILAGGSRIPVIEHLAVTGRLLETDVSGQVQPPDAKGAPEYEKHLTASVALAAVAKVAGQTISNPGERTDGSTHQVRGGVRDGSVVVIGRMSELKRPYRIVVAPALDPGEASATVHWVCGDAPVDANRVTPAKPLSTEIPSHALPQDCRRANRP